MEETMNEDLIAKVRPWIEVLCYNNTAYKRFNIPMLLLPTDRRQLLDLLRQIETRLELADEENT